MRSYKTEGIIIKRRNIGEADRFLTVLTPYFGKITVSAKGVRKILSKLKGHLELFNHSKLIVHKGRTIDIITGAETIESFKNLKSKLSSASKVFLLSEILDKILHEEESHPEMFELFLESLQILNRGKGNGFLVNAFILKILSELGYKPELNKCVHCTGSLKKNELYFSPVAGGLFDGKCIKDEYAFKISHRTVIAGRILLKHRVSVSEKIRSNKKIEKELDKMVSLYLEFILESDLKSRKFLREVEKL